MGHTKAGNPCVCLPAGNHRGQRVPRAEVFVYIGTMSAFLLNYINFRQKLAWQFVDNPFLTREDMAASLTASSISEDHSIATAPTTHQSTATANGFVMPLQSTQSILVSSLVAKN